MQLLALLVLPGEPGGKKQERQAKRVSLESSQETELGWGDSEFFKGPAPPCTALRFHFWLQGLEETVTILSTDR